MNKIALRTVVAIVLVACVLTLHPQKHYRIEQNLAAALTPTATPNILAHYYIMGPHAGTLSVPMAAPSTGGPLCFESSARGVDPVSGVPDPATWTACTGGGGGVITNAPITGNGSGGSPVTLPTTANVQINSVTLSTACPFTLSTTNNLRQATNCSVASGNNFLFPSFGATGQFCVDPNGLDNCCYRIQNGGSLILESMDNGYCTTTTGNPGTMNVFVSGGNLEVQSEFATTITFNAKFEAF